MTTETTVESETRWQVQGKDLVPHPELGLCLDLGCGSGPKRPAKGYSAYCDVIQPRNGVVLPEPYWCVPMENLRVFDDKTFDWVRSHHSIEHCDDPDQACAEIQRVGKAGIISFPTMQAELMFGRQDHRWFVCIDRGRLLFIRKQHGSYNIPRQLTGCQLNVDFQWEGGFRWQVVK
jgi:SAM-dependent methyltransferase